MGTTFTIHLNVFFCIFQAMNADQLESGLTGMKLAGEEDKSKMKLMNPLDLLQSTPEANSVINYNCFLNYFI